LTDSSSSSFFSRVKLPKTFLAVNLSDAFTFEEQERHASDDNEGLEMKATPPKDLLLSPPARADESGNHEGGGKIVNPT
jgi:hypothetical protein